MRAAVLVVLSACGSTVSRDAGSCDPTLALVEPGFLASAGDNQIAVLDLAQTNGLTVSGTVVLDDGGTIELSTLPQTATRNPLWDTELPTGTHTVTMTTSCERLPAPGRLGPLGRRRRRTAARVRRGAHRRNAVR